MTKAEKTQQLKTAQDVYNAAAVLNAACYQAWRTGLVVQLNPGQAQGANPSVHVNPAIFQHIVRE